MDADFKKQLLEFYKECYEAELSRKEASTSRLTLSLAIISLVFNMALAFLNNLPHHPVNSVTIWFYSLLGIGAVCGLLAIFFYSRALVAGNYLYGYIPSPKEISEFIEQAELFNAANFKKWDQVDLRTEFEENLLKQYRDNATQNASNNHRRSNYLYWTSLFSVAAMLPLVFAAIPFFIDKSRSAPQRQEVEILNAVRITDERRKGADSTGDTNAPFAGGGATTVVTNVGPSSIGVPTNSSGPSAPP